jgi:hypothetical protein
MQSSLDDLVAASRISVVALTPVGGTRQLHATLAQLGELGGDKSGRFPWAHLVFRLCIALSIECRM